MKILISEKLSPHKYKTPEGYLICVDSVFARTGKQTYKRREVFGDTCEDGDMEVEVDRPYDEVFSQKTLASFENKPICVEHPDEDVNCENYKHYSVGFCRDIHKGNIDGEPVMLGTLVFTDADAIADVESGKYTELSCGYDCDIVDSETPCQRNIRGNHVAICEQGRAGIARIVDSVKDAASIVKGIIYSTNHEIAEGTFGNEIVEKIDKNIYVTYWIDGTMHNSHTSSYMIDPAFWATSYNGAELDMYDFNRLGKYINAKSKLVKIAKEYLNDSVKDKPSVFTKGFKERDARMKVANLTNGYAIVPASEWRKFGLNSEVERFTTNLDEARYIRSSLERNDGISFVIVDVTQRRTTDFMKDALIHPTKEAINLFESLLRTSNIEIERKGLTMFGRVHYQVRAFMPFNQFVKKLDRIDNEMNKLGIPMTFNAGADGDVCTAGIDLDRQYVKDSQRAIKFFKGNDSIRDTYKKFAVNKAGKQFVIEERDGRVIVRNEFGSEKEFRSIKEAEETLRRHGLTILDEETPSEETTKKLEKNETHFAKGIDSKKAFRALDIIKKIKKM